MGAALSCGGGGRNLLNSAGNGDAETVREVSSWFSVILTRLARTTHSQSKYLF